MTTTNRRMPVDYVEQRLGMTNFDHSIDAGFESVLREGRIAGRHVGGAFNGMVWFEDGQFYEEVWVYRSYRETISADTLNDLMHAVNDRYGAE